MSDDCKVLSPAHYRATAYLRRGQIRHLWDLIGTVYSVSPKVLRATNLVTSIQRLAT